MQALKQQSPQPHFTYKDYANWELKEGERFEIINGLPYAMASPSQAHQEMIVELCKRIGNFLDGKPCKLFIAPFDVCLNAESDNDDTVIQPDLLVVCDHSKLDGKRVNGAPDLVIEIVSPSSGKHDRFVKFQKYQDAGVREYWIVDIEAKGIEIAFLKEGKYDVTKHLEEPLVSSFVLEGFQMNIQELFAEKE
ncbi:MAG: Uma2 family endonuclease [Oscillospiraceae bacterium]|nr:Uma2 family endonuclease [Oscillospiraceae bacterium]